MSCQHGNPFGGCDLCDELLAEYRSGIESGRKQMEQERDALIADNERLREVLEQAGFLLRHGKSKNDILFRECGERIDKALATTTEHSLARIRNQVRDECATAGGPEDSYQDEWFKAKADSAARILAMLEPE